MRCSYRGDRQKRSEGLLRKDFFYKCDEIHSPQDELVIRWDDPVIGIDWKIGNPSLSARDAAASPLSGVQNLPRYGQI